MVRQSGLQKTNMDLEHSVRRALQYLINESEKLKDYISRYLAEELLENIEEKID